MAKKIYPCEATLDAAWAAFHEGNTEEALRLALTLYEADDGQLGAALVAALCLDEQKALSHVALLFAERGELLAAVFAAAKGADGAMLKTLCDAFAKGSPLLGERQGVPPVLPLSEVEENEELAGLGEDALRDWAREVLSFEEDDVEIEGPLPALPLFSELAGPALGALLQGLSPEVVPAGRALISEGEEGHEAYWVVAGKVRVCRDLNGEDVELAMLGPGALFGEMALVSDAPRAATVRAAKTSVVFKIERSSLEALAAKAPVVGEVLGGHCRQRMLRNLVRHSPVLDQIAPDDREALIARFESRYVAAGDVIIQQGTETEGLFLIASGSVQVIAHDLELAKLSPGEVFGEIGLVLRRPANATVKAVHPALLLCLPRNEFQQALQSHPGLLPELYAKATSRDDETQSLLGKGLVGQSLVGQGALDLEDVVLL